APGVSGRAWSSSASLAPEQRTRPAAGPSPSPPWKSAPPSGPAPRLEADRPGAFDRRVAALAQDVVALDGPAAGAERPGQVIGRAVGPVRGPADADDEGLHALAVVGHADHLALTGGGQAVDAGQAQGDVVGHHLAVGRREGLQQRLAVLGGQRPADPAPVHACLLRFSRPRRRTAPAADAAGPAAAPGSSCPAPRRPRSGPTTRPAAAPPARSARSLRAGRRRRQPGRRRRRGPGTGPSSPTRRPAWTRPRPPAPERSGVPRLPPRPRDGRGPRPARPPPACPPALLSVSAARRPRSRARVAWRPVARSAGPGRRGAQRPHRRGARSRGRMFRPRSAPVRRG